MSLLSLCQLSLAVTLPSSHAPYLMRAPVPRLSMPAGFFEATGWKPLAAELDKLPVWTCANEDGQPLQYEREDGTPLAMIFAELGDAQKELANAQRMFPELPNIDLIPMGLGNAYQLSDQHKAMLIPGTEALNQAKGPDGMSWPDPTNVPLFGCLEISQTQADGSPALPLFLSAKDAEQVRASPVLHVVRVRACVGRSPAWTCRHPHQRTRHTCPLAHLWVPRRQAVEKATAAMGDDVELEMICMPLQRAIELLVTVPGTPAFRFIPPKESMQYIQAYTGAPQPKAA